jgi:quinolinate synthase
LSPPECEPAIVCAYADYIGSTTALLNYCQKKFEESGFIVVAAEREFFTKWKAAPNQGSCIPAPPMQNCALQQMPHMRLNRCELYLAK